MWPFQKESEPNSKKYFYILLFILLGWMVMFLLYALIEYLFIILLISDFDRNSLGLSWEAWWLLQKMIAIVFSLAGISIGYLRGRYWWQYIYVDHKLDGRGFFARK